MNQESKFLAVRDAWLKSAIKAAHAREEYRVVWARAYLDDQGTEGARKAAADVATTDLRLRRDEAEVVAEADWQVLLFERGAVETMQAARLMPEA